MLHYKRLICFENPIDPWKQILEFDNPETSSATYWCVHATENIFAVHSSLLENTPITLNLK